MTAKNPHDRVVRRAALPEVMFADDVALALGILPETAIEVMESSELGPCFSVNGRPALLRTAFLDSLARRAAAPGGARKEVLR